jgi:hypothetical protein
MADIYRKSMPIIGLGGANAALGIDAVPANVTSSSKGLFFVNTNTTPVTVVLTCYGATAGSTTNVYVYVPGTGTKADPFSGAGTLLLPVKAKQIFTWDAYPQIGGLLGYEIY